MGLRDTNLGLSRFTRFVRVRTGFDARRIRMHMYSGRHELSSLAIRRCHVCIARVLMGLGGFRLAAGSLTLEFRLYIYSATLRYSPLLSATLRYI